MSKCHIVGNHIVAYLIFDLRCNLTAKYLIEMKLHEDIVNSELWSVQELKLHKRHKTKGP